MNVRSTMFPIKHGAIVIEFSELDAKNLLLDLESQSKRHRESTMMLKKSLGDFIKRIEKESDERRDVK